MRKLVLTLTGILLFLSLSATGDSLNYLTAKDTVFLKLDDFGNNIFGHQLAKGQTMYSLAKFYGLKIEVLYGFNPSVEPNGAVPPEQIINIPVPDSVIVGWNLAWPRKDFVPVFYTVKHGDTFYKVAKTYFDKPLDSLRMRNRLTSTTLFTGQRLQIGWLSTKGIPEAMQPANRNPFGLKMQQLQMSFEQEKGTKTPQFHNGAAYWQREKKGKNDCYALHRLAPVGSVVQITNPLRRKTVYAEVIAPIPDQAYGDDIVVVLSPTIAKLLGAKDPKFFVEIRYFGN